MLRFMKSNPCVFGALVLLAVLAPPLASSHEANHDMQPSATASGDEGAFLRENEAAMTRMMENMAAKPAGDIDRDFVAMMVPHHQGAIDMAQIELRYGKNEQLRRMAQEIIVDQTQEIAAMKLAIGEPAGTPASAPTNPAAAGQTKK